MRLALVYHIDKENQEQLTTKARSHEEFKIFLITSCLGAFVV
jgi:hypothetical protein